MNLSDLYRQARTFSALLRADAKRIGKDSGRGLCGIEGLWTLPVTFPWYQAGVCQKHDILFEEARESLKYVQQWWVREAWKASPTWALKLFYLLTLPAVLSWTHARYRGPR